MWFLAERQVCLRGKKKQKQKTYALVSNNRTFPDQSSLFFRVVPLLCYDEANIQSGNNFVVYFLAAAA